jgi:hypothetical protein
MLCISSVVSASARAASKLGDYLIEVAFRLAVTLQLRPPAELVAALPVLVDFAGVLVGVTVRLMSDGELGRLKVLRGFGSAAAD